MYVVEFGNHRIRVIDMSTRMVTTLAGSATNSAIDAVGTFATFNNPTSLVLDPTSSFMYVTDFGNHRIRKVTTSGIVSTFVGAGAGSSDATGTLFYNPKGIAIDATFTYLFVTESSSFSRIRKITISSAAVALFAGSGTNAFADGDGAAASFNGPFGIVQYGDFLFVADMNNHRIRKVSMTGTATVSSVLGTGSPTYADGVGTYVGLNAPAGLSVSASGVMFIADSGNNRIRRVVMTTMSCTTLVGFTATGFLDGAGGLLNVPLGVAVNNVGDVYVADTNNHAVRFVPYPTAVYPYSCNLYSTSTIIAYKASPITPLSAMSCTESFGSYYLSIGNLRTFTVNPPLPGKEHS